AHHSAVTASSAHPCGPARAAELRPGPSGIGTSRVTHATNIVEHPELVAERITRYTGRLGSENVIAGADCGFGSRIHPELGRPRRRRIRSSSGWPWPAAARGAVPGCRGSCGALGKRGRQAERGEQVRVEEDDDAGDQAG